MTSRTEWRELTDAERERARARLEQQRQRLLERVYGSEVAGDDGGLTATHGAGETEHVVLGMERGITAALDTNLRSALEATLAALDRLADGNYGQCATCGEPIGLERLAAMPETSWCVRCQAHREQLR
jgi:RNA polymerase-binding transcription factor DksA